MKQKRDKGERKKREREGKSTSFYFNVLFPSYFLFLPFVLFVRKPISVEKTPNRPHIENPWKENRRTKRREREFFGATFVLSLSVGLLLLFKQLFIVVVVVVF